MSQRIGNQGRVRRILKVMSEKARAIAKLSYVYIEVGIMQR